MPGPAPNKSVFDFSKVIEVVQSKSLILELDPGDAYVFIAPKDIGGQPASPKRSL
jgi:hypothetical protein